MPIKRLRPGFWFFALALAACGLPANNLPPVLTPPAADIEISQATLPAAASPVEAQLDQPFTLPVGGEALLANLGLTVIFNGVLQDSRCPSEVNCAERGQAVISIQVQEDGGPSSSYELNDNPPMKADRVTQGDYTIQFAGLDPYPERREEPIPPAGYVVTLVVRGIGP